MTEYQADPGAAVEERRPTQLVVTVLALGSDSDLNAVRFVRRDGEWYPLTKRDGKWVVDPDAYAPEAGPLNDDNASSIVADAVEFLLQQGVGE